jgi:hypothetical protein
MRLLLKRSTQPNKLLPWRTDFVLWARFELTNEERIIIRRFNMEKGYLTIEGSWRDFKNACVFAFFPALFVTYLLEFLQEMRKRQTHTEFACFIRNVTPCPVKLSVPFGQMESQPRMSEAELQQLLQHNSRRYCAGSTVLFRYHAKLDEEEMGDPEVL